MANAYKEKMKAERLAKLAADYHAIKSDNSGNWYARLQKALARYQEAAGISEAQARHALSH
jgi:hypothetical protein